MSDQRARVLQSLVQYFKGANEEGVQLNLTTPFFLDFFPTVGEDGVMNWTTKSFNGDFILPNPSGCAMIASF